MLNLREHLTCLQLLPAGAPLHDIRLEDTVSGLRGSCLTPSGYVWVERNVFDTEWLSARDRAIRQAVTSTSLLNQIAVLPQQTPDGLSVYGPLPTPHVLVESLVPDGAPPVWPTMTAMSETLGQALAELHDVDIAALVDAQALLRCDEPIERVRGVIGRGDGRPPVSLPVERLQEHLLMDFPELAHDLRDLCAADHRTESVLVHGGFAPGFVMGDPSDGQAMAIIGWRDAHAAPRARDIGWYLGEVQELTAAWQVFAPTEANAMRDVGRRFLHAYLGDAEPPRVGELLAQVSRYAALKIVHHLWQSATFVAYDREPFEHMLQVAEEARKTDWLHELGLMAS